MPKFKLTVSDIEDGQVRVETEFDPPCGKGAVDPDSLTPAQQFGLLLIDFVMENGGEARDRRGKPRRKGR